MTEPPVVRVDWLDSNTQGAPWADLGDVRAVNKYGGALACHTLGYLVAETADTVTIAHTYTLDELEERIEQVSSPITIPRVAITKLRKLKVP